MRKVRYLLLLLILAVCGTVDAQTVRITTMAHATQRELFAAEYLKKKLQTLGYQPRVNGAKGQYHIKLTHAIDTVGQKPESFVIQTKGRTIRVVGNGGSGVIYACVEIAEQAWKSGNLNLPEVIKDSPEMVLRGGCVGLQKPVYLPGHGVYEYPYTPENFPWFYDKAQWIKYLDMLVDNRMNSLYLWNGHPFASLVKLKDYPFAVEVDDSTFKKNEEMFSFLTKEADRRGIFVIQMFYNIILSKPFADHYGLKTQDRHRPILSENIQM